MIHDAEKELFEIVSVWKLDRFSRDRYDSAYYKHILKKHNIRISAGRAGKDAAAAFGWQLFFVAGFMRR